MDPDELTVHNIHGNRTVLDGLTRSKAVAAAQIQHSQVGAVTKCGLV